MMNATLSMNDWKSLRNLDDGMYGVNPGKAGGPENPLLTTSIPRIITLPPGQVIFRWCHSGAPVPQASPWWSTKRGAQAILRRASGEDTSESARAFSNVARKWDSDMLTVVMARVRQPVRCFLGVGRAIWDAKFREVWKSNELQLYIPNMTSGKDVMSTDAHQHFDFMPAVPSSQISPRDWDAAISRAF